MGPPVWKKRHLEKKEIRAMDCIFCKIALGEVDTEKILETEDLYAINDINPQAPAHALVIPKAHFATLLECDDASLLGEMLDAAKKVAESLGIDEKGFRSVINTGVDGGQVVAHLHLHVLGGRKMNDSMG